ncbi:hypothetical protein V8G54_017225, partial [Vigna mungo]
RSSFQFKLRLYKVSLSPQVFHIPLHLQTRIYQINSIHPKEFLFYIKTQEKSILFINLVFHKFCDEESSQLKASYRYFGQLWNGKLKRIEWIKNMNILSVGMYIEIIDYNFVNKKS